MLLAAVYVWRLAAYSHQIRMDAADPRRAFGLFTLAAGSDVLAARLAGAGQSAVAVALLAIGGISWALVSYGLPLLLAGGNRARPAWPTLTGHGSCGPLPPQSIAVGITSLPAPICRAAAALAVTCWASGSAPVPADHSRGGGRAADLSRGPAGLTPAYWVFMGAAAISVLAGAQILQLPPSSLQAAVHAVIAGLSVVLWAFGTWLIPLLIVAGVWRHVARRVPLAYKPGPWSLGRSMSGTGDMGGGTGGNDRRVFPGSRDPPCRCPARTVLDSRRPIWLR